QSTSQRQASLHNPHYFLSQIDHPPRYLSVCESRPECSDKAPALISSRLHCLTY
ncbi:hypothetical protein PgNI_10638, partial [Pyricularia grisea]|uniref:Uncharacterized protein n=1 Tax=Pyricularia grisea TaxID=148305 RepID=A0A6P8AXU4_PYRGI